MKLFLVGAGPWSPGLLTLRGAEVLGRADVVFFDHLANPELIELHCRSDVERVFVGKRSNRAVMSQEEIQAAMVAAARAGRTVVRLKGGDPFLFGRGGEEGEALSAAGLAFEVVPGVTSALAGPAFAGIPMTDRRSASSVAIVTGHQRQGGDRVDLGALGQAADTVVFLMGVLQLRENLQAMVDGGLDPATPAAVIRWATRADQQTVVGTAGDLADLAEAEGLRPPAVVVVGHVVARRKALAWFEKRPLFGRTVVVTRPSRSLSSGAAADSLVVALTEQGATVMRVPAIALRAPEDSAPLKTAVAQLDHYDWLVLTSRNAVERFASALEEAGLDSRAMAGLRVACVGPATVRRAWELLRVRADLVPEASYRGAALADALIDQGIAGRRLLHPRASAASEELAESLREAGAEVDDPVAYETVSGDTDPTELLAALRAGQVDAVTFASGSAVDGLVEMVGINALREVTLAAIGPVTVDALACHGLTAEVVPDRSTASGLVDALVDRFRVEHPTEQQPGTAASPGDTV